VRREDRAVRRTYRFRLTGLVYLAVTAFLAVAAISSQNNLLFWCLGLALAGIAVSGLASGAGLTGIRAERQAVPDSSVGGEMIVRYRIHNRNRLTPAFGLVISECEPARRRRVATPWQRYATRPVAFVASVAPGATVYAEARARAFRRGRPEFTEFVIASTFPFGLANKSLRFVQRRAALVYPSATPVRPSVLKAVGAGGESAGPGVTRDGSWGDLYGIREYLPGDSMRAISWRASARVNALVVKQHALPSPRRVWVRLELGGETDAELVEATISLGAGVLHAAADEGFAIGLLCPEHALATHPVTGRAGLRNALSRLALIGEGSGERLIRDAPAEPSLRDAVITVRPRAGAGAGLALAPDAEGAWRAGPAPRGGAGGRAA